MAVFQAQSRMPSRIVNIGIIKSPLLLNNFFKSWNPTTASGSCWGGELRERTGCSMVKLYSEAKTELKTKS